MPQKTITTCSLTYRDEAEGDLVYESDDFSTVERTNDKMIVKIYIEKHQNWLQVADELRCEVAALYRWSWEKQREGKDKFVDLDVLERNPHWEKHRQEEHEKYINNDNDEFLYLYFHDTYNWVIYENDDQYMFLYEMPTKDTPGFILRHQIGDLCYWAHDDAGMMLSFLRSWYYRVNGYPEDKDDE